MIVDLLGITLGPGTAFMSMIKAELEATNMVAMEKIKVDPKVTSLARP